MHIPSNSWEEWIAICTVAHIFGQATLFLIDIRYTNEQGQYFNLQIIFFFKEPTKKKKKKEIFGLTPKHSFQTMLNTDMDLFEREIVSFLLSLYYLRIK